MSGTPVPAEKAHVLLLAGDVRETWRRALEEGGFEVVATGWLDGVTAARLRRPDLVLVSADLPANAPQTLLMAFRSPDLKDVPVAIAGLPPDVAERAREQPLSGDRYIPAPVALDALVREVDEAVRAGRVPWKRPAAQTVALALVALGLVALFGRVVVDDVLRWSGRAAGLAPPASTLLVAAGVASLVVALVLVLATRKRPFTPGERRTVLGWTGLALFQTHGLVQGLTGVEREWLALVGPSLGLVAWSMWAWLGPRVKPRTRGARRGWNLLAALLLLLAALPWIVLATLAA